MIVNERMRADAFFTCRQAVLRARRYAERLAELSSPELKAIRYETPRVQSSGGESSQHVWLSTVETVRQEAAIAAKEAETEQRRARLHLSALPLPDAKSLFCECYYILGLPIEQAAAVADRTERHCRRYMREIFTYDHSLPIEDPENEIALEDAETASEPPQGGSRPGARQPALKAATGAHRAARAQSGGLAAPQAQVCP